MESRFILSDPSFHCSSSSVSFLSIFSSPSLHSQIWASVFSSFLHNAHFVSWKPLRIFFQRFRISFLPIFLLFSLLILYLSNISPFLYLVSYSCILRKIELFQFCSSLAGFLGRSLFLFPFLLSSLALSCFLIS